MKKIFLCLALLQPFLLNTIAQATVDASSIPLEVLRTQAKAVNPKSLLLIEKKQHSIKKHIPHPRHTYSRKPTYQHRYRRTRVTIYPGSLKGNIQRLARYFGWPQMVWNTQEDFRWVGKTIIQANNFSGILQRLLQSYPLQATFYRGNHVLVINPRTIK